MKLLANAGKWNESKRLKKTRNPLPRDVSQSTVCPWDVSPSCTWTTSTYWNTWRPSESAARQKRVGVKSRIGTMVRSLGCRWCGLGSFLALRVIPKYSRFCYKFNCHVFQQQNITYLVHILDLQNCESSCTSQTLMGRTYQIQLT